VFYISNGKEKRNWGNGRWKKGEKGGQERDGGSLSDSMGKRGKEEKKGGEKKGDFKMMQAYCWGISDRKKNQ